MIPLSPPPEIVARINASAETPLAPNAQFYHTQNGYWIAWQPETAAVLPPDLPAGEPCDWVEGAESLAELVSLITKPCLPRMPTTPMNTRKKAAALADARTVKAA